ncbi:MAG: FadR family transcriptional regulator [Gammaproteobacteria bacterium]|nr:FadR family transcriptional regulator [Gammaproteobacteria bacterium]
MAEEIKRWIVERNLKPGDRLPQEKQLIEYFQSSKGTVRESIKALESQGLITTRSGPGGGGFVAEMPPDRAMSLLSNYFYFKDLHIRDIYQLRIQLEPELAASLCGNLTEQDLQRLKTTMTIYSSPTATREEEHRQRLDELAFHEVLADLSPNPILSFVCRFLLGLLKHLDVCHEIYDQPNQDLFATGRFYQMALYDALKNADPVKAASLMREHMLTAERIMLAREREIKGKML